MSQKQDDVLDDQQAGLIARANEQLASDEPQFRLGAFRKCIGAAHAQTWPKYEAFLEHGLKHGDRDVAALASINLLNHFGYSRSQKELLFVWDAVFERVKGTKNLGEYLILARIAAKRLAKARFDKVIGLAFRDWGHGLADPSALSDSELKHVRRFANYVSLAGDEAALLDEFERRGIDSANWRRALAHAEALFRDVDPQLADTYWARWSEDMGTEVILNGEAAEAGVLNVYPKLFLNPDMPQREAYMVPFLKQLALRSGDRGLKLKFKRGACNPTVAPPAEDGAKCVSFHSIADRERPGRLHIKESHLRDFVSVDTMGYSGWSSLISEPLDELDTPSEAFLQRLREQYVAGYFSYAGEAEHGFEAPAPNYMAVFLQINQDTTQVATRIPLTQLIRILSVWARNHQTHVVFKRHPYCKSFEVALALDREQDSEFVHTSDANIHDIAREAMAVVTTNSGAGFEVLLQGKTVVTTGRCDYQQATIVARNPDRLRRVLNEIVDGRRLDQNNIDAFVQTYLKRTCIDMKAGDLGAQIDRFVLDPIIQIPS